MAKEVVNDKFALRWFWPSFVVPFQKGGKVYGLSKLAVDCLAVDFFINQGLLKLA